MAANDIVNEVEKDKGIKENSGVLKKKPFGKNPFGQSVKMTGKTILLKVNVITILDFGKIDFGFGVLNISKIAVMLGGVSINKIINKNIGNNHNKNLKVNKEHNNWDSDQRNQRINTRLAKEAESKAGGIGEIADSLN